MPKEPVIISGLGAVSAAGSSVAETLASFREGRRSGGPVTLFESPLGYPAFEVGSLPASCAREGLRTVALTLAAVQDALLDAGLQTHLSSCRVGVCLGTTAASQQNDLAFYRSSRANG